ncbi:DsrE family protein [Thiovibrio sp. JS02]
MADSVLLTEKSVGVSEKSIREKTGGMMKEYKVVLHINETARWQVALGNAANLLKAAGEEKAEAVCLANGSAVLAYEDAALVATMRELAGKGVIFLACRNSMRKMKEEKKISIGEEGLPDFVQVVPAGILALVERQQAGYAYVKP